jgi:hypothetical protein
MQDITKCSWASLLGLCAGSMQGNVAKANGSVENQPKISPRRGTRRTRCCEGAPRRHGHSRTLRRAGRSAFAGERTGGARDARSSQSRTRRAMSGWVIAERHRARPLLARQRSTTCAKVKSAGPGSPSRLGWIEPVCISCDGTVEGIAVARNFR